MYFTLHAGMIPKFPQKKSLAIIKYYPHSFKGVAPSRFCSEYSMSYWRVDPRIGLCAYVYESVLIDISNVSTTNQAYFWMFLKSTLWISLWNYPFHLQCCLCQIVFNRWTLKMLLIWKELVWNRNNCSWNLSENEWMSELWMCFKRLYFFTLLYNSDIKIFIFVW